MRRTAAAAIAAVATALAVTGCGGPATPAQPQIDAARRTTPHPTSSAAPTPAPQPSGGPQVLPPSSHVTGTYQATCTRTAGATTELPVPSCTPGATRTDVTETSIGQNICVRGWTATVRPPQTETDPVKTAAMRAYGVPAATRSTVELDHLVPLELGGSNDVSNLWPEISDEPGHGFNNRKDHVENDLKSAVCAHQVPLADAQRAIAIDWTTAEHAVGLR